MNAYLWEYTSPVTDRWHDGGAVLVFAESLDAARAAWNLENPDYSAALEGEPDRSWVVPGAEPLVLVFEDSGCC